MTVRVLPPGGHGEPPPRLTPFQQAVVALVGQLAPGEVVTYADVALEIGRPGSAQAVANVLRQVPGLPWWRVVPSTGRIYRTHAETQVPLLRAEGVEIDADRRVHGARSDEEMGRGGGRLAGALSGEVDAR